MSQASVIQIKDLIVQYKDARVIDGVTLSVKPGEIFGFLGPNGAGKSSTIKTILGLLFPKSGTVTVLGRSPSDVRSRAKIGYLPEETTYYRFLSPKEILTFYGRLFGIPRVELKKRIERLLGLVGLEAVANRMISTFSKGMTQKMSLAQCLINDPELLILDEPTSGLDPIARMGLRKILSDLRQGGKTIFFSSHELSEVEMVCDSVAILKAGKMLKSGTLREILGTRHELSLEQYFLKTIHGEF